MSEALITRLVAGAVDDHSATSKSKFTPAMGQRSAAAACEFHMMRIGGGDCA
jgi:hypothetical protein